MSGQPTQDFQRLYTPDRFEQTRRNREFPDLVRRPAAIGGVGKHIMDGQDSARHNPARPAAIIGERCLHGMTAIDEEHAERCRPVGGDLRGLAHDRDHHVFQTGAEQGSAQARQGLDGIQLGVEEIRVVILLARLMLLGAAMVIEGVEDTPPSRTAGPR